jgi:hypothetical protein
MRKWTPDAPVAIQSRKAQRPTRLVTHSTVTATYRSVAHSCSPPPHRVRLQLPSCAEYSISCSAVYSATGFSSREAVATLGDFGSLESSCGSCAPDNRVIMLTGSLFSLAPHVFWVTRRPIRPASSSPPSRVLNSGQLLETLLSLCMVLELDLSCSLT